MKEVKDLNLIRVLKAKKPLLLPHVKEAIIESEFQPSDELLIDAYLQ